MESLANRLSNGIRLRLWASSPALTAAGLLMIVSRWGVR